MTPNPLLGVVFHWLGGFAAGSFYVPYRGVRHWSWETYWLVGGFFSWVIAPLGFAVALTADLPGVLARAPVATLGWAGCFGFLWGLGGLTFGLTMRYLGLSLGYGIALGICAVCGTLIPPVFNGTFPTILSTTGGRITLLGILVCVVGIGISALAGIRKEREMSAAKSQTAIREFNLKRGLGVALFCGVMSACMAFALEAAAPLAQLSAAAGTPAIWTGLPKLVIILFGGFLSNMIWCLALNRRHRTSREYFAQISAGGDRVPLLANTCWCATAGLTWYLQFFFYSMGETQMGKFSFSSWTLHMASIIIFSTLWGVALKEWSGVSTGVRRCIASGLAVLGLATLIVGYGGYLAAQD